MDKLYIGDIPLNYKYAVFSADRIDLFAQPNLQGTLQGYQIRMYDNYFTYASRTYNYATNNTQTATQIEVTNDYLYRRDFPSIMFMSVVYVCILVILFNLVSSVFKKGGLLGGLL